MDIVDVTKLEVLLRSLPEEMLVAGRDPEEAQLPYFMAMYTAREGDRGTDFGYPVNLYGLDPNVDMIQPENRGITDFSEGRITTFNFGDGTFNFVPYTSESRFKFHMKLAFATGQVDVHYMGEDPTLLQDHYQQQLESYRERTKEGIDLGQSTGGPGIFAPLMSLFGREK